MSGTQRRIELPYNRDATAIFSTLRDLPGAVLLDSGNGLDDAGRYDILAADPDPERSISLAPRPDAGAVSDFFARLNRIHLDSPTPATGTDEYLPFTGGLIGFLGYDAGLPLHGLRAADERGSMPAAQVGYYPWAIVQDHATRRSTVVAEAGVADAYIDEIVRRVQSANGLTAPFHLRREFRSNLSAGEYAEAFTRVSDYIQAGDCYQVNLAQRFTAPFTGDPFSAYRLLRPLAAAAFAGYIDAGNGNALLCLSPERFLSLCSGNVSTQPIKGTRPRDSHPGRDRDIASELQNSSKDRAENLMIVDLLRNDIGQNCQPGSVRVESLFALRSYPTVHHLVSTIHGTLQSERSAVDLLRDSFPGGSVTGAPKRRAMQIIAELEPAPRQAYCGTLFYLCNSGRMDSNILIRSLVAEHGHLHCWAGGGLVADSRCAAEYQETLDKVGVFLRALEACSPGTVAQ